MKIEISTRADIEEAKIAQETCFQEIKEWHVNNKQIEKGFDRAKQRRVPIFNENKKDEYFLHFEKICLDLPTLLQTALKGKIQKAYVALL